MSITITLSNERSIDGVIATVNRMNQSRPPGSEITPEQLLQDEMDNFAKVLADYERIAVLTSLGFVQRFTPEEYGAISNAAKQSPELGAIVEQLIQAPTIVLTDPRIAPALALLTAVGLLAPGRAEEIVAWDRPEFIVRPRPDVAPEVVPDVAPDVAPEQSSNPDATPEQPESPEVAPEVTPDVAPDTTTEQPESPEVVPDTAPEVTPDTTPEQPITIDPVDPESTV